MSTPKRLLKTALPFALAAACASPMLAQMPTEAPGKMDKSRVVAGTYAADANHSLVAWRVNHMGFNDYFGLFGNVSGTLVLDPAKPADAKVTATIPVSKVITANPALTDHLLRAPAQAGGKPDFFGPAPADATFTSTKVTPHADGTSATVDGTLTLNGVTKPVSLEASFVGAGTDMMAKVPAVGFHGETTIKRSEFGVGGFIPLVGDEVPLSITIAFVKKG
ncbi:YceI family protein [Novosphingobium sp. KCTC 2891]|uniref:YceI family protein n=1 Tax=Novosphingobium sp. KCTC 2891 TaxID=2989730 RepID=UPI0022213B2B|nr:YceI family protein [Novosphingobium sp. KCTC 2891]MCW1381767.1 YceI family protein [Novosphingobium sp. KCTC 2891]